MLSWLANSNNLTPQPLYYKECPSPITVEDYSNLAQKILKEILELESSQWNEIPLNDPILGDIQLFDREIQNSPINVVKIIGSVSCTPQELLQSHCLIDIDERRKFERDLIFLNVVQEVTKDIAVIHFAFKCPFPVTDREIVMIRCKKVDPDGTCYCYGVSINHPDCPTDSKYVRAVILHGAIIKPFPNDPNRCICIRLGQADPKGSIPAWIIKQFKRKAAEAFDVFRKVIMSNPHLYQLPPPETHSPIQNHRQQEGEQQEKQLELDQEQKEEELEELEEHKEKEKEEKGKEKMEKKTKTTSESLTSFSSLYDETNSEIFDEMVEIIQQSTQQIESTTSAQLTTLTSICDRFQQLQFEQRQRDQLLQLELQKQKQKQRELESQIQQQQHFPWKWFGFYLIGTLPLLFYFSFQRNR